MSSEQWQPWKSRNLRSCCYHKFWIIPFASMMTGFWHYHALFALLDISSDMEWSSLRVPAVSGKQPNKPFDTVGSLRVLLIQSPSQLQVLYHYRVLDSLHQIQFFINTFTPSKLSLFIFSLLNVNFAWLGHCTVPLLCMSEPLQPIYFVGYITYLKLYVAITIVFVITAALAENSYMFAYLNSPMRKGKIWTIHCAFRTQFFEFKRQVFLYILYACTYDVISSTFWKTDSYSVHHM
jgi:hypothetical protein